MGAEGAVDILYKRELDGVKDREAARQKKVEEFASVSPTLTWPPSGAILTRSLNRETLARIDSGISDAGDQAGQEPA